MTCACQTGGPWGHSRHSQSSVMGCSHAETRSQKSASIRATARMNATAFRYPSFQCFSCQRTAPASRRSLGTQLLRPQCDLQEAEIQDGAVEVLSEKWKENVPSIPIFPFCSWF